MLPIEIGLHSTEKVLDLKGVDVDTGKSQKNPFTRELYYPLLPLPLLHVQTREISRVGYELSQLSTFILMAEIRSFQGNLTGRIRWAYFRKSGNGEMPGVATVVVACCCSRRTSCLMPRTLECCEATRPEKGFQCEYQGLERLVENDCHKNMGEIKKTNITPGYLRPYPGKLQKFSFVSLRKQHFFVDFFR